MGPSESDLPLIIGEPIPEEIRASLGNDEQEFWKDVKKSSIKGKIDRFVDGAKQIISLDGVLLGLYFAALSFSSIGTYVKTLPDLPLLLLFVTPAMYWCIGLRNAIEALQPPAEEWVIEPQSIKVQWNNECKTMSKRLWKARLATFMGVAYMMLSVIVFLVRICNFI